MNTAALRNGVSKLHGHVSREMFREFHGDIDVNEVPIGHITNGVHLNTWLAPELKALFNRFFFPAAGSSIRPTRTCGARCRSCPTSRSGTFTAG